MKLETGGGTGGRVGKDQELPVVQPYYVSSVT